MAQIDYRMASSKKQMTATASNERAVMLARREELLMRTSTGSWLVRMSSMSSKDRGKMIFLMNKQVEKNVVDLLYEILQLGCALKLD